MAAFLPSKYVLVTSVASLIMDGEPWERDPYSLMPHRQELLVLQVTENIRVISFLIQSSCKGPLEWAMAKSDS